MTEDRQIDAISIGIGVSNVQLKQGLSQAAQLVREAKIPDRTVRVSVKSKVTGEIDRDIAAVQKKFAELGAKEVPISLQLNPTQGSVRGLRDSVKNALTQIGGLQVPVKADLQSPIAIKRQLEAAIPPIRVALEWYWGNGEPPAGGGGGGGRGGGGGKRPKAPQPGTPGGALTTAIPVAPTTVTTPAKPVTAKATTAVTAAPRTRAPRPEPTATSLPGVVAAAEAVAGGPARLTTGEFSRVAAPTAGTFQRIGGEAPVRQTPEQRYFRTSQRLNMETLSKFLGGGGQVFKGDEGLIFSAPKGSFADELLTKYPKVTVASRAEAEAYQAQFAGNYIAEHTRGEAKNIIKQGLKGTRFNKYLGILDQLAQSPGELDPELLSRVGDLRERIRRTLGQFATANPDEFFAALGTKRASTLESSDVATVQVAALQALDFRLTGAIENHEAEMAERARAAARRRRGRGGEGPSPFEKISRAEGGPVSKAMGRFLLKDIAEQGRRRERARALEPKLLGLPPGHAATAMAAYVKVMHPGARSFKSPSDIDLLSDPDARAQRDAAFEGMGRPSYEDVFGLHDPILQNFSSEEGARRWAERGGGALHPGGPNTRKLDPFDLKFPRNEKGGPVKGRFKARIAALRAIREGLYLTGEKRPELYESESGQNDRIVGKHGPEVFAPPENGKIIPFVPEWRKRALEGKGVAKDLTGRQEGGRVRGPGGRFISPDPIKAFTAGQGGVQRVFVVNWPPGLTTITRGPGIGEPVTARAGTGLTLADLPEQVRRPLIEQELARRGLTTPGGGGRGGRGTRVGGGGPAGGGEDLGPIPNEVRALFESRIATLGARQEIVLRRALVAGQIQQAAARAIGPDVGQILAAVGGRAGIAQRQRLAQLAEQEVNSATGIIERLTLRKIRAERGLAEAREAGDIEGATKFDTTIKGIDRGISVANDYLEVFSARADALSKDVVSTGDKFKVLGSNIVGIATGTLLFSTVLGAFQGVIEKIGQAGAKSLDSLTGYLLTTNKTTDALRDQTLTQQGNARAVAASVVAQSGLSGEIAIQTTNTLALRAAGEAANTNLQTQADLIRTAGNIRGQRLGRFDRSVLLGTGGLDIGAPGNVLGTPSTLETLTQTLRPLQGLNQLLTIGTTNPFTQPGQAAQAATGLGLNLLSGGSLNNLKTLPDQLKAFNANLTKAGSQFQFRGLGAGQATDEQVKNTITAINELGLSIPSLRSETDELAQSFATGRIAIVDANGKASSSAYDLATALNALQQGALKPTGAQLIAAGEQQRAAQIAGIGETVRQQLERFLPAQQALEVLGNQPLPGGTGILPPLGAAGFAGTTAVPTGVSAAFRQYVQIANVSNAAIIADAQKGLSTLAQVVPQGLLSAYSDIGSLVVSIQTKVAGEQATLAAVEYNHQLFLANRNLADAEALAGKRGKTESGLLGFLQRETFELQKQSQVLALQLQQRQINFQLALAGFQAPGETSEERAARQAEALVEATYAQRQLNIAKKEFGVGIQIFNESALRQLQEARFGLADLERQHVVQLDASAAAQAIAALQTRARQLADKIGVYLTAEQQKVQAAIGETVSIVGVTGEAFGLILKQTAKAWGVFVSQGTAAVGVLGGGQTPTQEQSGAVGIGKAGGFLGTYSSPTQMIVGEAGRETVAVIKNPQLMAMGGGGGGAIVIDVHDNTFASIEDEERMLAKITRAVEIATNRKASLLGFRSA